ncbi:PIG-L deacetylase family protein [Dactylosporangium sp. AC04546]|uniref:PIG-L deacetylase family protein n=1 Tax=Dactylosporangium sp. AC04546 TaxID=2862460 RepID=UPI001EE0A2D4|nr:PIG-L deacetylase family protein [Dactylosporangium sp. AC04546]WVK79049.1 PIG-L deacetylase family protein [Dactylosporangium sp. AC04546]
MNPERALVVVAHPDDVDYAAAGTVAGWVDGGTVVTYCVLTDGEAGTGDAAEPPQRVAARRRAEQVEAAAAVGVSDVRFLGYPDGVLTVTSGLRRDIARVVRQVRPQRVLAQSPQIAWDFLAVSHPDHRAAGEAALGAVFPDARNPAAHRELLLREGLQPWAVTELWLMGAPQPNHFVDVTATFERKLAALCAHRSQIADPAALRRSLPARQARVAEAAGLSAGRLAEPFYVASTGTPSSETASSGTASSESAATESAATESAATETAAKRTR